MRGHALSGAARVEGDCVWQTDRERRGERVRGDDERVGPRVGDGTEREGARNTHGSAHTLHETTHRKQEKNKRKKKREKVRAVVQKNTVKTHKWEKRVCWGVDLSLS